MYVYVTAPHTYIYRFRFKYICLRVTAFYNDAFLYRKKKKKQTIFQSRLIKVVWNHDREREKEKVVVYSSLMSHSLK